MKSLLNHWKADLLSDAVRCLFQWRYILTNLSNLGYRKLRLHVEKSPCTVCVKHVIGQHDWRKLHHVRGHTLSTRNSDIRQLKSPPPFCRRLWKFGAPPPPSVDCRKPAKNRETKTTSFLPWNQSFVEWILVKNRSKLATFSEFWTKIPKIHKAGFPSMQNFFRRMVSNGEKLPRGDFRDPSPLHFSTWKVYDPKL